MTQSQTSDQSANQSQQNQGDSKAADAGKKADDGDLLFGKKSDDQTADKKDETQDGDKKDGEAEVTYDLTIPEDAQVVPEIMDDLKAYAKENKLSKESAQKIVDLGVKFQNKQLERWNETKAEWREEVRKDPTIGGHNLQASIKAAEAVVARFGGNEQEIKEMQDDLVFLGLGNKKSFIRFCANIAKATADDTMDGSANGGASRQEASLAQRMWPNMPGDKQ